MITGEISFFCLFKSKFLALRVAEKLENVTQMCPHSLKKQKVNTKHKRIVSHFWTFGVGNKEMRV